MFFVNYWKVLQNLFLKNEPVSKDLNSPIGSKKNQTALQVGM